MPDFHIEQLLMKTLQALCFLFLLTSASGQVMVRDSSQSDASEPTKLWVPYAFNTETFDLSVGLGGIISGLWQEQMTLYATAFHTKNDSTRIWLGAYDIQLPGSGRLFLSPEIFYTDYSQVRAYVSGNPSFPSQQSATHVSHSDNFISGKASI